MPNANPRKTFLRGFSLLRFQLILLVVSSASRALYWSFHAHARMISALIYTFVAGNISILLLLLGRPLYERRARPWNWIGYIVLLAGVAVVANVVAELPVYLLFVPKTIAYSMAL